MQEFFVANNRVDIARNQIVREGQVIALEPKVLEVLRVLAENQGDVVSHQTLLDTVWPDIVVAPNALQRCIGQLRKALNDDGKNQRVIATHPKKGYSLLAPVSIRSGISDTAAQTARDQKTHHRGLKKHKYLWLALVLAAAFGAIWLVHLTFSPVITPLKTPPLQKFTRLSPITATDASEFYSTFSPDGRYVAFSRKVSGTLEHMWLLDRETGREIRLTQKAGDYGKPNWSTDGKQMAFLETASCPDHCEAKRCVDIDVIFVPLALTEPQPVTKPYKCAAIPFLGLEWISEKNLAAILDQAPDQARHQETDQATGSSIIEIDSQTGAVKTLFESNDAKLYSLSYSSVKQSLAVMQVKHQQTPSLFLLSPEHGTVTDQLFTPPERYNSQVHWAPVWDHAGENFLFSASSRLYLMDLEGKLHSQIIPTFEDISYPMFHPNGDSIAMTLGKIDTDVAQLHIAEPSVDQNQKPYTETPFARSILRESHAQYQPGGNMIAFFSKRGGSRQIWLTENDQLIEHQAVFQLSHIDELFPEHFVWSPNGQQIAVSTEHQLVLLDLQGKMQWLPLPFRITQLYQWLPDNELLMQIMDADGAKLVRYQIATQQATIVQHSQTLWAQSNGNNTWFIDSERRLKQIQEGNTEKLKISAQLNVGARFFLRNQKLFILSNKDDIWRLNLNNNTLTRLFHYPNTTVHLTDVSNDGQQLLISKQLSAKKEIVLLTP